MQTITFYSYKGGTGRTLVVANVARYLSRFGQTVVVLDFDLEAPGLHYKLQFEEPGETLPIERGVVDYFHRCVTEHKAPQSLQEFFVPITRSPTEKGPIHLMAAGNVPSADYWLKLSQVNWHEFLYAPGAKGVVFFLELKERIREEFKPDFLLIDARTGISEIGGIATAVLADKVVCLLLNNRENLEGARAVLRSLRRTVPLPGAAPVEIIAILARIPSADGREQELEVTQSVQSFLCEPAENFEDSVDISDLFVLHSEPDLEMKERLRIGGDKSPDESVLLRDYLRLFARLISPEIIRPQLSPLVQQARQVAFDDPDRAQKELELLAESGHPDAYRELLKFYRLRNIGGETALRTAQRFWGIVRPDSDPVLWACVKHNFKEQPRYGSDKFRIDLNFVEQVWRAAGADDVRVGCDLAESFDNFGERGHAADLLLELVGHVGADPHAVSQSLRQLNRAERWEEGKRLVETYREELLTEPRFVREWAVYALRSNDKRAFEELGAQPMLGRLTSAAPDLACQLLVARGAPEQALRILDEAIEQTLHREGPSALWRLAELFAEAGLSEQFEERAKRRVPEDVLVDLRRRSRRWR